ncbi:MAG TPA: AAA family ATPase [Longimicrobiaceae bacterium]|nr:AAA family ATPase [Longimicrobiaceae bacterium]
MLSSVQLLNDLREGHLAPGDLNWKEFQEVVYQLVAERLRLQFPDTQVRFADNEKGIIDIILEYPVHAPNLLSGESGVSIEKCFIECKRYTRNIELDTAAKAFCAAIHHRPRHLWLVTLNGMSPQAWEYARHFFQMEGSNRALTNVEFGHVRLTNLLGLAETRDHAASREREEELSASLRLIGWHIVEHATFYSKSLSSTDNFVSPVYLQADRHYSLRMWIERTHTPVDTLPAIRITGIGGNPDRRFKEVQVFAVADTQMEIEAWIDLSLVPRIEGSAAQEAPLTLHCQTPTGLASIQLPFPVLQVQLSSGFFPDLREEESAALARRLAEPNGERVIFVSGEAGIGKSYLCEQAAATLVRTHGYTAHSYSVLSGSDHLVVRMLLSIVRPSQSAVSADNQVLNALVSALLRQEASPTGSDSAVPIVNYFEESSSLGADAAAISLCASLLAESPIPRLLYVQNCQALSPQEIKGLGLLLAELESKGWGAIRLLFEYRDTGDQQNALWDEFTRSVRENIRSSGAIRVQPLPESRIVAGIAAAFLTEDPGSIAASLMRKAGGNPLYLDQVLHYLVDLRACRRIFDGEGRAFVVVEDHVLLNRSLKDVPEAVQPLLRQRLARYVRTGAYGNTSTHAANYLTVLSVVGSAFDRRRLTTALELDERQVAEIEWQLIRDGILTHGSLGTGADFVHDLMRLSASELAQEYTGFLHVAQRLESLLDADAEQESLIGGSLNLLLRRYGKALHWFEIAYERARLRGDYSLQREALLGSSTATNHLPLRSLQEKLRYIEILMALGWNEMYTGSQSEAARTYERAHRYGAEALRGGNVDERRRWQHEDARIRHHIVTCLLRMQRIRESVALFEDLVGEITAVDRLFHVLNRYLLLCCATGLPSAGYIAARTACGLAEILDDECISVVMSDIGHLYQLEAPDRTLDLWHRGTRTAQEFRQKTHSQINVLVGSILANKQPRETSEFERLLRVVKENGITGQLTRLYMYAGVQASSRDAWDEAMHWFGKAHGNARMCNQPVYEWQACNNTGVASIVVGDQENAERYFMLAAGLVLPLLEGADPTSALALAQRFEARAHDLCRPDQSHYLTANYVTSWPAPVLTGAYWNPLYNLHRLRAEGLTLPVPDGIVRVAELQSFESACDILDNARNPLAVQTRYDRLTLVLE